MNIKSFKKITDWLKSQNIDTIQILGGEPLLHNNLYEFLQELHNKKMKTALITNATISIDEKILYHPSILNYLINVAASTDKKDEKNIEMNIKRIRGRQINIILGTTIYDRNQNFDYLFKLCNKYKIKDIRLDLSLPDLHGQNVYVKPEDYIKFRPLIIKILKKCKELEIYPSFDCGLTIGIFSIFSKKEIILLKKFSKFFTRNFCLPTMDIFPDFSASFCFPMKNIRVKNVLKHDFYDVRNILMEKIKKYVDYDKGYQGMCIRNIVNLQKNKCIQ